MAATETYVPRLRQLYDDEIRSALKDQLDTFWRRALDGFQNTVEDNTEESS